MTIKQNLANLRSIEADPAISIFVETHRTYPDNEQDHIAIKNQLKLLEERLNKEGYDKRQATAILENINAQLEGWDHNYNLDTLAIYATEQDAVAIRLPFETDERIIIDTSFALRDLIRDMASAIHYYIVVVTRERGRLIEAINDRLIAEIDGESSLQENMEHVPFPIDVAGLYTTSGAERSAASKEDDYLKEFLNRVDKSVQEIYGKQKLPLVIVGDKRNISFYKDQCDRPENIIFTVSNSANLEADPIKLVHDVQDELEKYRHQVNENSHGAMEQARGSDMLRTDLQEVYQAAYQGNAETLYVREHYIQPAKVDEKSQSLTLADDPSAEGVTDDVVGRIIELTLQHGGEVIFLPQDVMEEANPIAVVTRY